MKSLTIGVAGNANNWKSTTLGFNVVDAKTKVALATEQIGSIASFDGRVSGEGHKKSSSLIRACVECATICQRRNEMATIEARKNNPNAANVTVCRVCGIVSRTLANPLVINAISKTDAAVANLKIAKERLSLEMAKSDYCIKSFNAMRDAAIIAIGNEGASDADIDKTGKGIFDNWDAAKSASVEAKNNLVNLKNEIDKLSDNAKDARKSENALSVSLVSICKWNKPEIA